MTIFLAVSRYPWPERSGDQRRTGELVAALAALGEVVVLAPEPAAGSPGPPVGWPARLECYRPPARWTWPGRALAALCRALPLETAYLGGPDLERRLRRADADLVVLQLSRLVPALAAVAPGVPLAVDLIDSLAWNFERRAAAGSRWLAPLLRLGAWGHRRAEVRLLARAAVAWLVAEGDRAAVASRLPPQLAAKLQVVPLVAPAAAGSTPSQPSQPSDRPTLILTGNLGYFPTRHGITGFLRDVWPTLSTARPELELLLAGARPPASLRRAAARAGARLLADPPDLRALLAAATVALAPLEAGTGQPIKVLEAWAEGVPVVASPAAAAGVGGCDGVDLRIADTSTDWRRVILELLAEPEQRARLAAAGAAHLAADYSAAAVSVGFRRSLEPLLRAGRRPHSSG